MKIRIEILGIIVVLALAAVIPTIVFLARSPVLVVTDHSFIPLYGTARIKGELARSSFSLFRRVKIVLIADDSGDDIVRFVIEETSKRPHSVIFPLRFAGAARFYRENHPRIPVIILEGRYPETENPSFSAIESNNADDYFIYKTDINADFYRAGLASAILDRDKNDRIAVFLETNLQIQAREAISQALNDLEKPLQASYFTHFSMFSGNSGFSCVVISGIGAEYFEKYSNVPIIFFSWIDPALVPVDVVLILDDSPLAQAVEAVRMASAGVTKGAVKSKPVFLPGSGIEKEILRKIKRIR